MNTVRKPVYKRILLKFSGEVLKGEKGEIIDPGRIDYVVKEIKELVEMGIQVGIVIGGGNLFRGSRSSLSQNGTSRIVCDHMGMLATVINGLAICESLRHAKLSTCLMSALPIGRVCDSYHRLKAINLLSKACTVIFSAGTGNPLFTTDSAACLYGIEIEADIVLKSTKVDGVYPLDPIKFPKSTPYKYLSYQQVLEKELQVMDLSAFILARDHRMPIRVFNMKKSGALKNIIMGGEEGTLISE